MMSRECELAAHRFRPRNNSDSNRIAAPVFQSIRDRGRSRRNFSQIFEILHERLRILWQLVSVLPFA